MKKVILSLAILVASSMSMFAATDNKTENKTATCTSQTVCNGKAKSGEKKDKSEKANKAFEGLNLTAEQQTKLAELRKSFTANKERGEKKNNGESKSNLTEEQKKQLKAENKTKRLESRKKYLDDVKSILTPEQYTKFLENNYLSSSNKNGKGNKQGMKMAQKNHGKKGAGKNIAKRGERGNKQAKENAAKV